MENLGLPFNFVAFARRFSFHEGEGFLAGKVPKNNKSGSKYRGIG